MSNRLLSSDARTLDGCLQSPDNQIRLAHTDLDIPCPSRDAFVPETMLNLFDTDIPSLFDFGVLEELHVVPEFNLATGTLTEGPFTPLLEQVPGERQSAVSIMPSPFSMPKEGCSLIRLQNDPTPDTHSHTWDYYPHCIERIDNSYPTPSVSSQSARLTGAYAKLYEYSSPEEDSRPQSPSVRDEYDKWLERLGMNAQLQCDPAVLEIMINLFRIRLSPTFRCFENFTICETTPTELFVAMAAVGCLYCKANDSMMVAKWLFNHARVVLLSKVLHLWMYSQS